MEIACFHRGQISVPDEFTELRVKGSQSENDAEESGSSVALCLVPQVHSSRIFKVLFLLLLK